MKFYDKILEKIFYGKLLLIGFITLITGLSFIFGYIVGRFSVNIIEVNKEKKQDKKINIDDEFIFFRKKEKDFSTKNNFVKEENEIEKNSYEEKIVKKKDINKELLKEKEEIKFYYTVQVGAFSKLKEAEKLKDKLENKGYTVMIWESNSNKKLYKVWVGKFKDKSAAKVTANKLYRNERLKTFILKMKQN